MNPATAAELANDSRLRMGSESKNLEEARELRLVSSARSKSVTGMPSFSSELMSLKAPELVNKHKHRLTSI